MVPLTQPSDLTTVMSVVALAALLHASFQLAVSVMTLLSGHALGRGRSHSRLMHLALSYIGGNTLIILLLLVAATYFATTLTVLSPVLWAVFSSVGIAAGLSVLLFYYRDGGKTLWIPKPSADFLYERTKKTTRGFEAFGLGIMTGIAELPFIATPMLLVALLLKGDPTIDRAATIMVYTFVATTPLLTVLALIGAGHKVSRLEQWRANNRRFLQLLSGTGLLVISLYAFSLFGLQPEWIGLW